MVLGVAAATAVLAGALVVGDSVRGSLRDIALGRLGRTEAVVSTAGFFREGLADDLRAGAPAAAAAPLVVAHGVVTHERSRRRAAQRARLRRGRALLVVSRAPERGRRPRVPCARGRTGRSGGGCAAHARAEAGTDPCRVAVRPQGGHRPHAAPPGLGCPAARAPRRVRPAAAADGRPRDLRAAAQHPARSRRAASRQHRAAVGRHGDSFPGRRTGTSGPRRQRGGGRGSGRPDNAGGQQSERHPERGPRECGAPGRRTREPARDSGLHLSRERHPQGKPCGSVLARDSHRAVRGRPGAPARRPAASRCHRAERMDRARARRVPR